MKYDDASWHYGGNFPADLAPEAGATHSGMFLAWAILAGIGGEIHVDDLPENLERLQSRSLTPGQFFVRACDGKLTNEDFNEEGNRFAQVYYASDESQYLTDYTNVLGSGLPSLYRVNDTWDNFDRLKPTLDQRLRDWRYGHS